ncbi:hypothetical protein ABID58_006179 [Bradyrhizobium sp. S3.2.6]|uniref:hypothetical protein n=1 Tax=Bradyrhizobium sp. S3.2.6 TaxID=3156428 RepID=UPI00339B2D8D
MQPIGHIHIGDRLAVLKGLTEIGVVNLPAVYGPLDLSEEVGDLCIGGTETAKLLSLVCKLSLVVGRASTPGHTTMMHTGLMLLASIATEATGLWTDHIHNHSFQASLSDKRSTK